jgi:hypothetical protein
MERCRQPRTIRRWRSLYALTSRMRDVLARGMQLLPIKNSEAMTVAREFDGEFWLKDRPGNQQSGVLEVAPTVAPTVKTVGALRLPYREERRTNPPDGQTIVAFNLAEEELFTPVTIHGIDNSGNAVTLLNSITSNYGNPDPSGRAHHYRGSHAIIGIHACDRDHPFTGYRIRFRNLNAWRPFLAVKGWASEITLPSGETLALQDLDIPGQDAQSGLWITIQKISPSTLRELDRRFLRPLMTFFSLALDTPCMPLALQVEEESPEGPWLDVYSMALQADEDIDLRFEQPRWLLQPPDISLHHVAAWLNKVEQLGPLPAVVADMAHADSISVDTQVLLLATVAEGMHRRLYPGDISYAKRLIALAEAVKEAAPGVTGKTEAQTITWKKLVYEARNEYAHRLSVGFLDEDDIDRRLTVVFSLRWLLTGLLLLQAEVAPPVIAVRLECHEQYQRFLSDATLWQPKIYGAVH